MVAAWGVSVAALKGAQLLSRMPYSQNTPFHDAGYDAYITGYAFVKVTCAFLPLSAPLSLNLMLSLAQLLAFSDLLPSPISSINTATPEGKGECCCCSVLHPHSMTLEGDMRSQLLRCCR